MSKKRKEINFLDDINRKRCKRNQLTVIDLFAGAGGLSKGFHMAGYDVLLAIDNNEDALQTYRKNFPETTIVLGDVRQITPEKLYKYSQIDAAQDIDVIVAGCPCQGFSRQNHNRDSSDERNSLVVVTAQLISKVKPRAFLLENVPELNLVGIEQVTKFERILSSYVTEKWIVNAANFGVPQTRNRCILVGIRSDLVEDDFEIPIPIATHEDPETFLTVRDAFKHLDAPPADGSNHRSINNHSIPQISPLNQKRLENIPEGGSWRDLPDKLKHTCHKKIKKEKGNSKSGGWSDVLGRLEWDKPSVTITGGCMSITKGRYAHPEESRGITLREAARLQSFSDDFVFCGSKTSVAKQIGNAVPPLLAKALAQTLSSILQNV